MYQAIKIFFILFSLLISDAVFTKNIEENGLWKSRQLLLEGQFTALEARLAKANDDYINGKISHRQFLSISYNFYKRKDFETDEYFNQIKKWIKQSPKSTFALSTMGISLNGYAFFLRGEDFVDKVDSSNLNRFKETNKETLTYVLKSIKYSNNNIAAYNILVELDKYLNNLSFKYDEVLNSTEEYNYSFTDWYAPLLYSFDYSSSSIKPNFHKADILNNMTPELIDKPLIWWTYAQGSAPKWGGSYEDMLSIVKASRKYLTNEEYFYLESSVLGEKMSQLNRNDKYDEVLRLGEKHLNKFYHEGFDVDFVGYTVLWNMAQAASETNKLDLCIKYARIAIESGPAISHYIRGVLGRCTYLKRNYKEAEESFKQYVDITESSENYGLLYLALINESLKNFEIAHAISINALKRKGAPYESNFNSLKFRIEKINPKLKTTQPFNLKEYLQPKPQFF